jgi:hypothetical protein
VYIIGGAVVIRRLVVDAMTYNRLNSKVDGNQDEIRRQLRALGFRVDTVSRLKKLYDLVVTGRDNKGEARTVRVEVKIKGGTLTIDEKEYHETEPYPETLLIAYSLEDVLRWFGRV